MMKSWVTKCGADQGPQARKLRAIKKAKRQQEPLTATIRIEKKGAINFGERK